jgi:hypothetical protein
MQRRPFIITPGRNRSIFFKQKVHQFLIILIHCIEYRFLQMTVRQRIVAFVVQKQLEQFSIRCCEMDWSETGGSAEFVGISGTIK